MICPLAKAKWIAGAKDAQSPVIFRRFKIEKVQKATLFVTGLGYFEAKINGNSVCEDRFLPVISDYEERDLKKFKFPLYDVLTHRIYYYEYDVTSLVQDGENELSIQLGNGFYRQLERIAEGPVSFGDTLKTIYTLVLETSSERITLCSDGSETWKQSEITYNNMYIGEIVNPLEVEKEELPVSILETVNTELCEAIGTPDRVIRTITPKVVGIVENRTVFDVGENISGVVRIRTKASKGEKITLRFAEVLEEDNRLSFGSSGARNYGSSGKPQIMEDVFIADGTCREYEPKFVWHTFRYFEVEGEFEQAEVLVIHSDVKVTAKFESPSEGLSFLWDAFLRTQLDNMHGSIPSDCPHRERLGYTGDGQICAPTVMMVMDSKEFYRKWIRDILDCQDKVGGHVQHTAPLMGGGGGPGGWGCAIIMVPYAFYKQYGDKEMLKTCYEPMKLWIRYLLEHSENGLVVREEKGGWCLGDWLTLEKTVIPEPYVNTCYLVKSLHLLAEMAVAIGKEKEANEYTNLSRTIGEHIKKAYLNEQTGHYCEGVQGADAYAVWAGLVKEQEREAHMKALAEKYDKIGHFDTGFLATDILTELLIEYGYADVLLKLLESEQLGSFLHMKRNGATTIWEDWIGSESLCHPMFGGVVRQLLIGFLGIRQAKDSIGYEKVEIIPRIPAKLPFAKGSIVTPNGEISVAWKEMENGIAFEVVIPEGVKATFSYGDNQFALQSGQKFSCII